MLQDRCNHLARLELCICSTETPVSPPPAPGNCHSSLCFQVFNPALSELRQSPKDRHYTEGALHHQNCLEFPAHGDNTSRTTFSWVLLLCFVLFFFTSVFVTLFIFGNCPNNVLHNKEENRFWSIIQSRIIFCIQLLFLFTLESSSVCPL